MKDGALANTLRLRGPPFLREFIKVIENIRRQLDVAALAVEVEDAVGEGGDLAVEE